MEDRREPLLHEAHGGYQRNHTTLPSISQLIDGKAFGLATDETHDEEHDTDEDIALRKASGGARRRSSRGRITDRAPKLEEKLKSQDELFEKEKSASREELRKLQMSLESEKAKCSLLEEMLDKERADRLKVEKEVEVLKTTSDWSDSRAGTETSA